MKKHLLLGGIIALAAASCAQDKSDNGKNPPPLKSQAGVVNQDTGMPDMPKDALYTIYCQNFTSPDHYERAVAVCKALHDSSPMKDWYITHSGAKSTLYYGFYRTFDSRNGNDTQEGARALNDLHTIRMMADASGDRPFSASLPVLIDAPDPSTHPEWDLTKTKGYYSLEVCAYRDSAERKKVAVESVEELRKNGIEAYYYHGPTMSSVCVGCWPKEAAIEIDPGAMNGSPDAVNKDPNTPVVVFARQPTQKVADQYAKQGIQTIAPGIRPVDPTMSAMMRQYPEHAVNGEVTGHRVTDPVTGAAKVEADHSFLVKIPHDETDFAAGESGAPTAAMRQKAPEDRGSMGRLKGLDN